MSFPDNVPTVTDDDLAALEVKVQHAIATKSFEGLSVLGFGEVGVAVGLPADAPVAVAKRLPSSTSRSDIEAWFRFLTDYEESLQPFLHVAPTEKRVIEGGPDGRLVPYLVQPLFARTELAEKVLEDVEPIVDHPMVVAVRDAALNALGDGRQAIDSQFSNFAWNGEQLSVFDCGTPFVFRADGTSDYRLGIYSRGFPAVLRPATLKVANKVALGLGTPNGNLNHAALSAVRLGQERWLDAIVETFNNGLAERGIGELVDREEVLSQISGLQRDMKIIKNVARMNRTYAEKVKRETYDFFITDSFTGELL